MRFTGSASLALTLHGRVCNLEIEPDPAFGPPYMCIRSFFDKQNVRVCL